MLRTQIILRTERVVEMYNEVIKKLLKKIELLPETLIVMYLMKMFGLSENMARQAVYSACRNRACYKKGENIARTPFIEEDSSLRKKAKAFRVLLEFLPDSQEFVCENSPWLLAFVKGDKFVQVCFIERNLELVTSMMIAEKPIPKDERHSLKRIAIVEEGCDLKRIKAAGFAYFCTVNELFQLKIIAKCDEKEAWADVPEKD